MFFLWGLVWFGLGGDCQNLVRVFVDLLEFCFLFSPLTYIILVPFTCILHFVSVLECFIDIYHILTE